MNSRNDVIKFLYGILEGKDTPTNKIRAADTLLKHLGGDVDKEKQYDPRDVFVRSIVSDVYSRIGEEVTAEELVSLAGLEELDVNIEIAKEMMDNG